VGRLPDGTAGSFALRAAPSARHRVAVADGRFGAARPGRGDAFESPTQSAQALCFSPPRIQKQKGHPEGGLLLLYPWRERGIPIMTLTRARTNFPEESIRNLPSLIPLKIIT